MFLFYFSLFNVVVLNFDYLFVNSLFEYQTFSFCMNAVNVLKIIFMSRAKLYV